MTTKPLATIETKCLLRPHERWEIKPQRLCGSFVVVCVDSSKVCIVICHPRYRFLRVQYLGSYHITLLAVSMQLIGMLVQQKLELRQGDQAVGVGLAQLEHNPEFFFTAKVVHFCRVKIQISKNFGSKTAGGGSKTSSNDISRQNFDTMDGLRCRFLAHCEFLVTERSFDSFVFG